MANPSGIPQIATQVLMPDGTMNPLWYRYLRGIGTVAMGSVVLIQDTLANRPDSASFHDASVIFIDIDTDLGYFVQGGAWVQLMNFIGFDGTTVTVSKPTDITGALAVTGAITSTTDISATGTIHGQFLTVVSTSQLGGALTVTSGGVSVLGGGATITGAISATTTITAGTGLTVSAGGASITGNSTVTGSLSASTTITSGTGLTVSAGGAAITGNSAVTGNLNCTASLTGSTVGATTTVTAGTQFITGSTGGETHTVPLGPLTSLGSPGSIDFTGGIETGHVDPT